MLKFSIILATGFGTGYSPIIPGTVGTLLAMIIYLIIGRNDLFLIFVTVISLIVGFVAIKKAQEHFGRKDPSQIVLDEIIGYLISVIGFKFSFKLAIISFLFFRFFDVLKPFPIRKSEELPGSLGIIADDLLAGLYTKLAIFLILIFGLL